MVKLLIGTRKGAFIAEKMENSWEVSEPIMLGNSVNHFVQDPREKNRMVLSVKTGHLGPTVMVSEDKGNTWVDSKSPPKFTHENDADRSVKMVFWLTPGHREEPGVWWAGTSPQGLFRSTDGGYNWESFDEFNQYPDARKWFDNFGTPAGPLCHSIQINPHDKNNIWLALSLGGTIESKDYGKTWTPMNGNVRADFQPDPYPEYGQCVHNLQLHPANPQLLYQQNHCGIYKLDRRENPENNHWERIGDNMPEEIGDIGFPVIVHPSDPDKIWVWPMDSSDVWPRISKGGKPAAYHSNDGGRTWIRQDKGFPQKNAYFGVRRQSMCISNNGLIFLGTTLGEIWMSADEGGSWQNIIAHLPDVYSVEIGE